jgi:hypothetical protein
MENLSHLSAGLTGGGSSMNGGNTISDPPWTGAVGSPSEATSDLPYGPTHNNPEMVLGPVTDLAQTIGGGDVLAGHGFTYAEGIGH